MHISYSHQKFYLFFSYFFKVFVFIIVFCLSFTYSAHALEHTDNFEAGSINSYWKHSDGGGKPQTLSTISTSTACNGIYSVKSKAIYPPDWRTEIVYTRKPFNELKHGKEYWVGIAINLGDKWEKEKYGETLLQFHHRPDIKLGEKYGGGPPLALRTKNGKWLVNVKTKSKKVCNNCSKQVLTKYIGDYKRNTWTEFVINVKFTHLKSGFLKVWKDDKLVINYSGPIGYNDERGPFLKMGLYKGLWKTVKSNIKTRTPYHDSFRIKVGPGSKNDVAPNCGNKGKINNGGSTIKPPEGLKIIQN